MASVSVGQKAPDFSLYDQSNKLHSLSEFVGKNVILAFYPGAFTGVCDTEMCKFRDSLDILNNANAQTLGISIDMPFTAKVFAQKYNLEFPLLSDYNRNVIRQYDLLLSNFAGLPGLDSTKRAVYLIDGSGVVRYMEVTATPHDEPDYAKLFDALKAL